MTLPELPGPKTAPNRLEAMPFYIACDVSESMHGDRFASTWGDSKSPFERMHIELDELITTLQDGDQEVAAVAHIAAVEFAAEARTLSDMAAVSTHPGISAMSRGTWTNYVAIWEHLAERVPSDVRRFQRQDRKVYRPTIFFITDGNPGSVEVTQTKDDWNTHVRRMYSELNGIEPRIVAIGLGSVNRQTLLDLHSEDPHGAAVIASGGQSARMIHPIVEQIKDSIIDSAVSGQFTWNAPAGMTNLCGRSRH